MPRQRDAQRVRLILVRCRHADVSFFFFFNDTATTEIYTLSLHDALPISLMTLIFGAAVVINRNPVASALSLVVSFLGLADRKSTRLNSSHSQISYAVFCLKKKKNSTMQLDDATRVMSYVAARTRVSAISP